MTSIPPNYLTGIFNTIDTVIGSFVQTTYHNLISNNSTAITLIFTLYVAILGYRFLTDSSYSSDIGTITRHLLFMAVIYALLMSWEWYNKLLYDIFTNEPEKIATVIIDSSGQPIPGHSVLQALDSIWQTGMNIALKLFMQTKITALQFIVYATTAFLATFFLCIFALGLFLYAKMGMAVMLALGPIFIILALFKPTKGFTQSWIQQLVTFALIPIVTSAVIGLMFTTINDTLGKLDPSGSVEVIFTNLIAYDLMSFVTVFLLFQVYPICSSLAGGVTLMSIQSGIQNSYNALKGGKNSSRDKGKSESSSESSKGGSGGKSKSGGGGGNSKGAQISKMKAQNRVNAAKGKSQSDTNKIVVATQSEIKRFG